MNFFKHKMNFALYLSETLHNFVFQIHFVLWNETLLLKIIFCCKTVIFTKIKNKDIEIFRNKTVNIFLKIIFFYNCFLSVQIFLK